MVRFLLSSNEFNVEGIVNSSSQFHWQGGEGWNAFHPVSWVGEQLDLYAQVYPNLILHDPAYPLPDDLRARWKVGNIAAVGEDEVRSEGAELIANVLLDETDPRPVWVQAWGGTNTIARALRIVREEHPDEVGRVAEKLRLFLIWEQDETYQSSIRPFWESLGVTVIIADQFDAMAYIWRKAIPEDLHAYFEPAWTREHLLENHGPLASAYESLDGGFHAEGDTPAFLHAMPNGLSSVQSPDWGGWGGRYVNVRYNVWMDPMPVGDFERPTGRVSIHNSWSKQLERLETPEGEQHRLAYFRPVWRWLAQVQNDFAARADWSVLSYAEANHHPVVRLSTQENDRVAHPGDEVRLDASASFDPDGDSLDIRWWHFVEAGHRTSARIPESRGAVRSFTVPHTLQAGDEIHMICEATDSGRPRLTRYQRVVIRVSERHPG